MPTKIHLPAAELVYTYAQVQCYTSLMLHFAGDSKKIG